MRLDFLNVSAIVLVEETLAAGETALRLPLLRYLDCDRALIVRAVTNADDFPFRLEYVVQVDPK